MATSQRTLNRLLLQSENGSNLLDNKHTRIDVGIYKYIYKTRKVIFCQLLKCVT